MEAGASDPNFVLNGLDIVPTDPNSALPSKHFDFGGSGTPVAPGYTAVNLDAYDSAKGYGWQTVTADMGWRDRGNYGQYKAQTDYSYDEQGRVYRQTTYSVDPDTGDVSSTGLTTDTWYDRRGDVVKTSEPGGLVTKAGFDGAGRQTAVYSTDGGGDASWSDAFGVAGDAVLQQVETQYDADGNVTLVTTRQRFDDETATGALGDPSTGPLARVSYQAYYYDLADRLTASADVGTNGGTAYARPSSVPARSDTVLVTGYGYDAAGNVEDVTDPKGIVTRTSHDALGRATQTVEDYTDGTPTDNSNKTTRYAYDGNDNLVALTVVLPGGGQQQTKYVYGVSTATGSAIDSNDVLGAVQHPDPTTGAASSSQQETYTVNALGQTVTATDRDGSVHTYGYDVLGRLVSDAVTTLGAGVDGSVRRVEYAYDGQGNPYLFTSYDAASGGNVVNQVKREFDGLGQMTVEFQAHDGIAGSEATTSVRYAYAQMAGGANNSRLTSITYTNGKVVNFNYAAGLDDSISRLSSISDSTGTLESYAYLGLDTAVTRAHPQPGVDLTYVKQAGEANGDAGDKYTGLDRFGRVVDQRWLDSANGVALDRTRYGYDADSNRTYRANLVNSAFGEVYAYDNLNQLTSFQRGTLNAAKDGISGTASRSQSWGIDAAGNFTSVTSDGSTQTRTSNAQNEVTSVSGAVTPAYDANGNLTTDETGRQLVYDAWGRLVEVKDSSGSAIVTYAYDALGRRISETKGGVKTDLYYSAGWQVVEERTNGQTSAQYVWSPVYPDALVLRDRDTNGDGTLDERLWAVQDANFNVTALVDNGGNVVERYAYDPYGAATVLAPDFSARAGGSSYGWVYLHQGLRYDAQTGLYSARERDYSPTLMRWVENDPMGFAAGDVNLYRALANSPANALDPSGLYENNIETKPQPGTCDPEWTDLTHRAYWSYPRYIGRLMNRGPHAGTVMRVVGDKTYYVPYDKVKEAASSYWGPVREEWNKWFISNDPTVAEVNAADGQAFLDQLAKQATARSDSATRMQRPGYDWDRKVATDQAGTLAEIGLAASPLSLPFTPLTTGQRAIRDTLLREHPGLHPSVATKAARSGVRAAGPGGAGADVILANTIGREVSVHSGKLSNLGSHIATEARQRGVGEIFVQINTPGATQDEILRLLLGPAGLRHTVPEASGKTVRLFGPNGESWWTGVFR